MRRNYFVKLIKYIKKVYNINHEINVLTDKRVNPSYKTGQVMLPVLLGFLLRIKSLNELNCMLKENEFKKLLPKGDQLPLIDTIRDTLKVIDLKGLGSINSNIIKKAIGNKVFANGTIGGYTVAAIDGTKIFGSNKKCCPKCLTTEIKGKTHYYHSSAVMSLVGNTPNLVIPSYKTGQVMLPVLLGFLLRIKSLNELNCMLKENEFKKLLPKGDQLPLIDTIRDTLKVIDLKGLGSINRNIIKKAIGNKVFANGTIGGYTVAAIDGTKIFGSNKKCCPKCLTPEIKGKTHYYHSGTVMSLVGNTPNLIINYEMYNSKVDLGNKDEGELNVAKRLLSRVISDHNNFVDIVAYDTLACNSKFINHCVSLGVDAVIRVKQNNNNAIKNIKRIVNKKEISEVWENNTETIEVYEETFYMSDVEQPLRYIKYAKRKSRTERSQILIVTTCLKMDLETLYKIIKARWEKENSVFNNLKNKAAMGQITAKRALFIEI